jgi:RNA polymerase sigma-B factor
VDNDTMLFLRLRAHGDAHDREALVRRYMPLARSLALRYRASDEPLDDLLQVAAIGLLNAVDRFDPARGCAFSSFAVPTILGELRRHFRDHTWAVRVPRDRQELFLRCERARDELVAALGRQPTVAELAERLGVDEERALQALELQLAYKPDSVEAVEATPAALDDEYARAEDRAVLGPLLERLTAEEAEVVRLRFHEDLTQEEIARRVGVSQMHVSRMLHRSIARLRDAARANGRAVRGPG